MKKIAAFAAAVIMVMSFTGAAVCSFADAAEGTSITAEPGLSEKEQAARKLGEKLSYKVSVDLICEDDTVIPTGMTFVQDESGELRFTAEIDHEKLVSLLKDAGKTIDDFKTYNMNVDTVYPEGQGIDSTCDVFLGSYVRWEELKDDGMYGYQTSLASNTIVSAEETAKYNLYADNQYKTAERAKMSFEVNFVEVYKPTAEQLLARKLIYSNTLSIKLKDGSEIDTDMELERSDIQGLIQFGKEVTKEEIEEIMKANGKTLDDFERFVFYVSTDYPEDMDITDDYVVNDISFLGIIAPRYIPEIKGRFLGSTDTNGISAPVKGDKVIKYETPSLADHYYTVDGVDHSVTFDDITGFLLVARIKLTDAYIQDPNAEPEIVKGDVNGDGRLDVTDLSKVAAHVKGKKSLTDDQQKLADFSGDDKVNVADISLIAARIKGKK